SDQYDPDSDVTTDSTVDEDGDGDGDDDDEDVITVTPAQADLSLTKIVVDGDLTPLIGSEITFEIRVFNDGPQDATGVEVVDLLPSGYDFILYSASAGVYDETTGLWTVGNVPAGGSQSLLIDVLVLDTGDYFNIAEVTASDVYDADSDPNNDDGDQSEDDEDNAVVTPVVPIADLSLTKIVVDGDVTPLMGSEITFQITVTNDGPQDATGVQVTDLLPSGYDFVLFSSTAGTYDEFTGIWDIGGILAGESETLLIDVIVNSTGDYLNITEVTASDVLDIDSVPDNDDGDQSEDDEDSAITNPVIAIADLELMKSVVDNDLTPLIGSEITFQIEVTNNGPQIATGVEVTDLLPSGYDFVLFSATAGSYDEVTGIWNIGTILVGEVQNLLIDVLVLPTGDYLNIAEVTDSNIQDSDSTPNNDDGDQSEDDEDSILTNPVESIADLSVMKDVVDGDYSPLIGTEITFIITVTNDGPENATGVELTDLLPSGFDFVLFSSTAGTYDDATGVWSIGTVIAGETETLLIDVNVLPTGDYLNIAEVTASDITDSDSTPNNDDGDQSEDDEDNVLVTPVIAIADLALTKTVVDNDIMPNVGDEITFQIDVTNDGPDNATGVVVTDLLPVGFDFVLYSATSGLYDENTGIWTVGDISAGETQTLFIDVIILDPTGAPGEFFNIAEVSASDIFDPDSEPGNDDGDQSEDDEDSILVMVETADLSMNKSVSNVNANVGDVVVFTIQLDNAGANDATNVEVVDIIPPGYSNYTNISNGGILFNNTITWTGLTVPLTGLTLIYEATVNIPTLEDGEYLNVAQITASDQFDPNSIPDNDDGDQSEDDEDNAFIETPTTDIGLSKQVDISEPIIGDNVTFTITATNSGNLDATSVDILEQLPAGYELVSASATSGTYDSFTEIWQIPLIIAGNSEILTLVVTVLDVDEYENVVSLEYLDQIDSNDLNDSASATIDPECLHIYNEFSPNGNGLNEVFYIDCINRFPNNKLEIYNRWGNLVYQKDGYDNTFDGTSNGRSVLYKNEKLPVGTYYYILDLGDGTQRRAGWLYIVR
ncbi:MAG: DUF11 domain-containing protein, partial [Bacteroidia bacterium]|nr:DUF11 domain-containing protein [Bacteroidia bacterium]